MARTTNSLVVELTARISEALDLASAAEAAPNFSYTRRLHVYVASYLLMFCAWENFLEQSLIRFLCGYKNSRGVFARVGGGTYFRSAAGAYAYILGGKPYLLWHNPQEAIDRCNAHLVGGPHATVIASALSDVKNFSSIRNHVAHRTANTRSKFDAATMALAGRTMQAGRAGRFLRSSTTLPATGAVSSWLGRISADLGGYAAQIAS